MKFLFFLLLCFVVIFVLASNGAANDLVTVDVPTSSEGVGLFFSILGF